MAFLVQHGTSRAIAAKAASAARERKTRHSLRAAAKNPSKLEHRHGQLAAFLLALAVCICVAKLLSVLSSRVSSDNGVHLVEGNLVSSDDTEGVGALSSWQTSISMDVTQGPSGSAPILPRADADPFRSSPKLGERNFSFSIPHFPCSDLSLHGCEWHQSVWTTLVAS
uniref:Uncharacterized protein n=1 Tax=Arundo donax TaxID=35708 RepID=A0A0A9FDY6_ARUDO